MDLELAERRAAAQKRLVHNTILNLIMLESMSLALGAQEDEGFKREELDPNMLREAELLQSYGHVPPYAKEGMPEEKISVVLPDINPNRSTKRGEPSFVSAFQDTTMRRGSLLQYADAPMTYPSPSMNPFGRKRRRSKKRASGLDIPMLDPVYSTHGRQP